MGLGWESPEKRSSTTNGIRAELIGAGIVTLLLNDSPLVIRDSAVFAKAQIPVSERINGVSLSALGTVCNCIINGVNVGLVGHIYYQVNGLTASGFMNYSRKHHGVQIAIIGNRSYEVKGLQIALFNETKKLWGVQLGLWNVNERRKLPLINWNFRRRRHF